MTQNRSNILDILFFTFIAGINAYALVASLFLGNYGWAAVVATCIYVTVRPPLLTS